GLLDRRDRVAGRDLRVAVELHQLFLRQPVAVRQRGDDPRAPEPANRLLADAVDVPDPVDERLEPARLALRVRTAVHRPAFGPDDLRAAERAVLRHAEPAGALRMREHRPDDLRDHVARALDDDGVPDADVLAVDVVLVVERRV